MTENKPINYWLHNHIDKKNSDPSFGDLVPCYSSRKCYENRCVSMVRVHNKDVIMSTIASQITSLAIVYSTVYSSADQRKHQSSASLAFVWGIHRGTVNSPHKWSVTRKMFPFDDVIMLPVELRFRTRYTTRDTHCVYFIQKCVLCWCGEQF